MSELETALDTCADRAVPKDQSVGAISLALVVVAIFVSLPAYIQGIQLGQSMGFYEASKAFLVGSMVLMCVGACCAIVGAKTRLSTYLIIGRVFGPVGAKIVNLVFSITIFGWFGVVVAEFSRAVLVAMQMFDLAVFDDLTALNFLGTLLMVGTAIFGFKGLNVLSNLVTPLLVLALGVIIYLSLEILGDTELVGSTTTDLTMGNAISSVVGSMIVSMVIFPDYSRYTKSAGHAVAGVVLSLSILPVFFATAALSGLATGENQLVPVIVQLGLGISGLLVIVFAAWTTNASNLYVTTLSLSTLIKGARSWQITLIAGALGFLVATAGISDHLIPFLLVLGTLLPPVGAVYVLHYFFFGGKEGIADEGSLSSKEASSKAAPFCLAAFAAWICGGTAGYFSVNGDWSLTSIATLDALAVTAAIYSALKYSVRRTSRQTA